MKHYPNGDLKIGSCVTSSPLIGAYYDDDERSFMVAMDRYKRENRRPYPQWSEVLAVFKSLGYRKVAETESLPRLPRRQREARKGKAVKCARIPRAT